MAVVPRSLFATDGSLLIPSDKASIMHAVENAHLNRRVGARPPQNVQQGDHDAQDATHANLIHLNDVVAINEPIPQ